MKRLWIIIAVVVVFVGCGIGVCLFYNKSIGKQDKITGINKTHIYNNGDNQDQTIYAVEYKLSDHIHTLKIKKSTNVYIKNTPTSVPESVTIAFSDSDFNIQNLPLGTIRVVPMDYVEKRTSRLKLGAKYADKLQEYMAFLSSTQCTILKPGDFAQRIVSGYKIWVGRRTDKCTFGVKYPVTQGINMYGFQSNGYAIIISVNGDIKNIPSNSDQLMNKVVSLITIE